MKQMNDWRATLERHDDGYYVLRGDDTYGVEVRLFLSPTLLEAVEENIYPQIRNATAFPGVKLVVITPDVHYGYGVPVGCVILTDASEGAVAMGPVGFDIGCGMMSAQSDVPASAATPQRRFEFNRKIMHGVAMGAGGSARRFADLGEREFERLVRGGADYYIERFGASIDRGRAERNRLPVDDAWQIPWGGRGRPERGIGQIGSLGGGNHFIELQRETTTDALFVQVHTGSRGFGHGLATNFFDLARAESPGKIKHIDLGYFTPGSRHYGEYLNAVSAGGNFAIVNRLAIYEEVAKAFRQVFDAELRLVYEISHNLVQRETHPEFGDVWVHRKGATRAFGSHHPALRGTPWYEEGHPVLIPGSNMDYSFILRPLEGAVRSAYSVNHGAGRSMSRSQAERTLDKRETDRRYREAGILVNADGRVPIDESAPCYKPSREVIAAVCEAWLARVEHELWPLASLKGTD